MCVESNNQTSSLSGGAIYRKLKFCLLLAVKIIFLFSFSGRICFYGSHF